MMPSLEISLHPDEQALADEIEFESITTRDHTRVVQNADRAEALAQKLIARGAIPQHRVAFFTDPAYHIGGHGKSRQQGFESNGCFGNDILRHPHFLPYLRYFILGPNLPPEICSSFKDEIAKCGTVTSGDVKPLCDYAKALTRQFRLSPSDAHEEFFKLALDCGLDVHTARRVRDAVKRIR